MKLTSWKKNHTHLNGFFNRARETSRVKVHVGHRWEQCMAHVTDFQKHLQITLLGILTHHIKGLTIKLYAHRFSSAFSATPTARAAQATSHRPFNRCTCRSCTAEVSADLPQLPTVVHPVWATVCSHWRQNISVHAHQSKNTQKNLSDWKKIKWIN